MHYLKQSTAITLKIGPFLDETDGKTAETGLTIAQADVRLSKNGGDIAQKTEATTCTHDELGVYSCPIDATDTGTLGRLQLWVHESGALPVFIDYMVVTANFYDSLFSTDKLQVDLTQIGGVAQSATDLKDFADAGYDPATNKVQGVVLTDTCTTNTDMRGTDGANTTVPDAAGVAPTAAEIKTEVEQAGSSLATILTDTNELQTDWVNGGRLDLLLDAIPTTAMRGTDSANTTVPDAAGTLASYDPPTRTEATADKDAIIADLLTMKKKVAGAYDRETDSLEAIRDRGDAAWVTGAGGSAPTVGEIRAEMEGAGYKLALIEADTNELQTDLVNGGRIDLILDRLLDVVEIKHGLSVAAVGATTTKFISDLTEIEDDYWNRMAVLFTSGNADGQMRRIKDYNGSTKEITLQTALDTAPANGDTFVMPAVRAFITPDIEDIADALMDELTSEHTGAGSLSKAIIDTLADTNELQGNQANWTTATGFSVPNEYDIVIAALQTDLDNPAQYKATGFSTHDAAAVKTAIEAAGSSLALILADTGTTIPAQIVALNDITVADIIAGISDGTLDLQEMMRIILAATAGKSSGGGTVTLVFRDAADSKARITATVDANGNRTAMTLDGA